MATDQERLLLLLEAQTKNFERAIRQAQSVADVEAAKIERRFNQMNSKVARDFANFQNQARTALAALGVGLVVRDVTQLADVWTTVGNRIAFAGVAGDRLAATQQAIADIASRTRSDLDATADLFARMFRASEDLGASQERVLRVTEIVSKALAGASQSERQGAIRQLGQGLASGRLQGDELRSILENSRPIAEAIAAEFDTTVGNLRKLGAAGVLESRRVFEAIERAGADIDQAFSRTNFTVADSFTRLRTEAARFIGTNEQTSGSVRALTRLIDALSNNFELFADVVIITATVLGGAFAGQAIARATTAILGFIGTLGTATARTVALQRALTFFGGPIGVALTVLGGTLAYVATQTDLLTSRTELLAKAEDSLYGALQVITSLEVATNDAADGTGRVADEANRAADELDELTSSSNTAAGAAADLKDATNDLAEIERERTLSTIQQAIADREALAASDQRLAALRRFQAFMQELNSRQLGGENADAARRAQRFREEADAAEESARVNTERAETLERIRLRVEAGQLRRSTGASPDGAEAAASATGGAGARSRRRTIEDLEEQAALTLARLQHQEATVRQLEDAADIEKRTTAYIDAGLASTIARSKAEAEVTAERAASNAEAQRGYEISQLQDRIELARIENNGALADVLSDQLEIANRARQIVDLTAQSEEEAAASARRYVEARREALNIEREHRLATRDLETQLEAARLRGDERAEAAIRRRLQLEETIAELRRDGVSEEVAADRAQAEVVALERADLQGKFREWFRGGVHAALDGDLGDYFENWFRDRAAEGLNNALDQVADVLFNAFQGVLSNVMQGGADGFGQAVSAVLTGGANAGLNEVGVGAAKAAEALGTVLAASAADAALKVGLQAAASAAGAANEAAAQAAKTGVIAKELIAMQAIAHWGNLAANALRNVASAQGGGGGGGGGGGKGLFSKIVSIFGGKGGKGLPFGGFLASGGPVTPGFAYTVGERGPETFVPKVPGYVVPNGAGGGAVVNYVDRSTYNFSGTQAEFEEFKSFAAADRAARYAETVTIVDRSLKRRQWGRN